MVQLKCISRKWRQGARGVIGVRWVYKWKFEKEALSADASLTRREVKQVKIEHAFALEDL